LIRRDASICLQLRQVAQDFINLVAVLGYFLISRTFSARICAPPAILVSTMTFHAHKSRRARQSGRLEEFASGLHRRRFFLR